MKPILEVKNISKKFRIQHLNGGYLSFRERILAGFSKDSKSKEDFWALQDVSFDVQEGESLGIIGRNGAGKSTLLKILSKITPPTRGKIITRGRIASLLEVGTGFHPELTGRENIFFNGSLLGMKRNEIRKKFDEIVEFSGTEKFLDTPLKHYSSGMQLRLAFSVAAFLEPEILVIDEVLAVGDAEFQKKCLGKMQDVTQQGRTILFVSHNLGAVKSLCNNGILLQNGSIKTKGNISEVVENYQNNEKLNKGFVGLPKPMPELPAYVKEISVSLVSGERKFPIPLFETFQLVISFEVEENLKHFIIGIGMTTMDGFSVRTTWSPPTDISPGSYTATFIEETIHFASGSYLLFLGLSSRENAIQYLPEVMTIQFEQTSDKSKIVKDNLGVLLNSMKVNIQRNESARVY